MIKVHIYTFISIMLYMSVPLKSMQQLSFNPLVPVPHSSTCYLQDTYSMYAAQLKALSHILSSSASRSRIMLPKLLPLSLLKYKAARYYTGNNQDNVRRLTLLLQQTNKCVQLNKRDSQILLEQSQLLKDMSGDLGDSGDQEIAVDMLSNKHQVALFLDCLALMPATKESDIAQELLNYLQAQSIPDLGALLTAAEFFGIDNTVDTTASFCSIVSKALAYKLIDTQELTAHQELVCSLPIEVQRMLVQHILDSTGLRSALHIKYNSRHPITVIPLENSKDNIGDLDSKSLSISPNKRYVAICCHDSDIRVWDSKTGKCLYTLSDFNHEYKPKSAVIRWSSNSKYFAAQAFDKKNIKIWDSQSGQCLQELSTDKQWPLKWSLDSKYFAYVADDTTIKIWNSETNQVIHELSSEQKIKGITWFSNSKYIVCLYSFSSNKTISIWDCESGQCLHELPTAKDDIDAVWYSPNSRYLAFISSNQTVKIWDSIQNEFNELSEHHEESIKKIVWSPNSKYLISVAENRIYMCDIASGRILHELTNSLLAPSTVTIVEWSPNSKYVAFVPIDNLVHKITVWDSENGNCYTMPVIRKEIPFVFSIQWSSDSKYLTCITKDYDDKAIVRIWNSENGNCFDVLREYGIQVVRWSPDGRYLYFLTNSKNHIRTIGIWDIEHNNCIVTYQVKNQTFEWMDGYDAVDQCIVVTNTNCLLIWHWINKNFDKELADKLTLKFVLLALHTHSKNKQDVVEQLVKSLWPMLNSNTSKLDSLKQSKSMQAALMSIGMYTGFKLLKYALQKAQGKG